jgi:hypothetical protein
MPKWMLSLVFGLNLSGALAQMPTPNKSSSEPATNLSLVQILDSMVTEDQLWRNLHTRFVNGQLPKDSISLTEIRNKIHETDSLNYFGLESIFNQFGFPTFQLVGKAGAHDFWLLVQHQDLHVPFQDSVLAQMKNLVALGSATGADYAYLFDRVKVNKGQLQEYGTQMQLNADSNSYEPKPVFEPEFLNQRRQSIGLNTIEAYIQVMNDRYFGSLNKNKKPH